MLAVSTAVVMTCLKENPRRVRGVIKDKETAVIDQDSATGAFKAVNPVQRHIRPSIVP